MLTLRSRSSATGANGAGLDITTSCDHAIEERIRDARGTRVVIVTRQALFVRLEAIPEPES
jgi:hypothetical protein